MFIFSFLFECFNLIFNIFSSAQVKDIGFTGVFRLIFKPLVDEFPCFGAVCCSLRQKVLYLLLKSSLILEIGKLYAHIYHIKREFDGNADVHQCRHVHASSLDTHMQIFNDGSGQVSCLWVIYSAQQFVIWIFFFLFFWGERDLADSLWQCFNQLLQAQGNILLSLLPQPHRSVCTYTHKQHMICEHLIFLVQKNMDFTLKLIGGDISTIPGLYGAIEV